MRKLQRSRLVVIAIAVMVTCTAAGAAVGTVTAAAEDGETDETTPDHAFFEVSNVETNAPITAGETIEVTFDVTNTGGAAAEKKVWFQLDEYEKDDKRVELSPGETESVTLTYVSKSDNDKDWTLLVASEDDEVERTVTIEEPPSSSDDGAQARSSSSAGEHPNFEIVEMDVNESTMAGEPLRMNATVENDGKAFGEKLVWFTLDGRTVNETIVAIPEGERKTVSVAVNTSVEQAGTVNVTANTSDDVERGTIQLADPESRLEIRSVETDDSVQAGESLTVTVDVQNVGEIAEPSPVRLSVDEHFIDETQVELAPNESMSVELQYRTNADVTGELNVSVATNNSSVSRVVSVTEPTSTSTSTTQTETETEMPENDSAAAGSTDSSITGSPASTGGLQSSIPGLGVSVAVATLLAGAVVATRWR